MMVDSGAAMTIKIKIKIRMHDMELYLRACQMDLTRKVISGSLNHF